MALISDLIEEFIIAALGECDNITLCRNELAVHFDCAPSQINYVLSTRFSADRGFVIDSRRGGGGYVTVTRINEPDILNRLLNHDIGNSISFRRSVQLLERLQEQEIMTNSEADIVKSAISDKALVAPGIDKEALRSNILKTVLINFLK